jgi:type I restriction enzyme R subunit
LPYDPRYEKKKAEYLLKSFVELHPHAINEKVRIMIEHFATRVQNEIGGKAKAMIVTRSRLHAVRYKLAVDRYLSEKRYPFKALVAFSGKVEDGGQSYTEPGMNGFSEKQTAKTFERSECRFLIVANKFQTGFDQPFLHTISRSFTTSSNINPNDFHAYRRARGDASPHPVAAISGRTLLMTAW